MNPKKLFPTPAKLQGMCKVDKKLFFKIDGQVFEISFDKPYLVKTREEVPLISCDKDIDIFSQYGETIICCDDSELLYAYDDQIGIKDVVIWHPEIIIPDYEAKRKLHFQEIIKSLEQYMYDSEDICRVIRYMESQ